MSLNSWMSSLFSTSTSASSPSSASSATATATAPGPATSSAQVATTGTGTSVHDDNREHGVEFGVSRKNKRAKMMEQGGGLEEEEIDREAARPPYLHSMLAGGIGGTSGDMLMHSLDTVKTRQQGDPHIPPRYTSMSSSYATILRQEGVRRGLYSGVTPALLGSFPGTVIFFGTYEYSKRHMLDAGINPSLSYLAGGFLADLAASVVYVPSEVIKTRQQLQGRYNNPFFRSGYNYRSTVDAFRTIVREEGFGTLFSGYKATLYRDLPFSALQFAFYEQEQKLAKEWVGSRDIGLPLEILTATTAGGMAGVITCPLDVVKTRTQTQQNPETTAREPAAPVKPPPTKVQPQSNIQSRSISTSSPSTYTIKPGAAVLDTSSVFTGLKLIYKTEGLVGWFRGVGPRFLWTSVQSGTMLVLYQFLLKKMEAYEQRGEELSGAAI
ncbi:hypothetical protein FQN51_006610 [Onygenales sp. PD_10]|nr:hypothetical protein FQN51_006610 [Onygenales sp. PD_10]